MSIFQPSGSVWTLRMLSVFRIVAAVLFVIHGTQKLFGVPAGPGPPQTLDLISERGLAGILEAFGGLALVLGVLTRPIALLLAGEMAVAYFQVRFPRSVFPAINGGEPATLFCFFFLYLSLAGPGPWSLDRLIGAWKRSDTA